MDISTSPDIKAQATTPTDRRVFQLALPAAVSTPVVEISKQLLGTIEIARFMAAKSRAAEWPFADAKGGRSLTDSPRRGPVQGQRASDVAARPQRGEPDQKTYRIRLLGPVVVAGVCRPSGAVGRARELVALLAITDGHRLTRGRLRDQLGAHQDRPMIEGYFRQTCARARALLGSADDGRPRLLYDQDAYALHPDVEIDWDDFQTLTTRAKTRGLESAEDLRQALSLVRGDPLEDCGYRWIDPMLTELVRARIVETAALLADLSSDDPFTAAWAACRGLLADPYAEPLYRTLMTASHNLGHTRSIYLAYQLCEQALALLDLTPHEQTTTLYRALTGTAKGLGRRHRQSSQDHRGRQ